ncbi:MAG: hypothetical protein ACYSOF_01545 [Planctomycetota bacterium]|jgi:hypothetical protein
MLSKKVFWDWFKKEVQSRWKVCHFEWTEIGDWHWRLQNFSTETLTEAVRQHKVCEDWRTPSLKKVYGYAGKITADRTPKAKRTGNNSSIPDTHTFIMCTARDERGKGTPGWFVDVLIWPFHKTYTAETYRRAAEEQCNMHAAYGGIWEIFTDTTRREMNKRSADLKGIKPLVLNKRRKRHT